MGITEAYFNRLSDLIEEIRGYMQQLPDGPELDEIGRQLEQMERILEEKSKQVQS